MAVQDGGVASVMASYNLVNSTKSTQNHHTLTDVMRTDFGFQGFILSDWWAMPGAKHVSDASTLKGVAVQAVNAGLDVELPWALNYGQLENIVQAGGGMTKAQVDAAAGRILEQKFRFNADPMTGQVGLGTPTTQYVNSQILCNAQHVALAQRAAVESMVLLKNDNNTLPINPSVTKVAVISASKLPYVTTNNGQSSQTTVTYSTDVVTGDMGSSRVFFNPKDGIGAAQGIQDAAPSGVQVVTGSSANDVGDAQFVVVMAGLTPGDEGEEYTLAGDRTTFALDGKLCTSKQYASYCNTQNNLISSVAALGKPMAVVLIGGSVIDVSSWLDQRSCPGHGLVSRASTAARPWVSSSGVRPISAASSPSPGTTTLMTTGPSTATAPPSSTIMRAIATSTTITRPLPSNSGTASPTPLSRTAISNSAAPT